MGSEGKLHFLLGPWGALSLRPLGLCEGARRRGRRESGRWGKEEGGQGEEEGQGKGEGRKGDRDRDGKTRARGDRRVQRISCIAEEARGRKTGEETHGQNGKSVEERGRDTETKTQNRQVRPRENTGGSRTLQIFL